jgi:hypothetical protein
MRRRREQQRIAVGLGRCDDFRGHCGGSAPALIDDDLLSPRFGELLPDQPRECFGPPPTTMRIGRAG